MRDVAAVTGLVGAAVVRSAGAPAAWAVVPLRCCCSAPRSARATCSPTTWCGCRTWRCAATSSGSGTALPRAVPSDAVVAVLDEVRARDAAPEAGAARCPGRSAGSARPALAGRSTLARLVAVSVYVVEPVRRRAAVDRALAGAARAGRCCPGWSREGVRLRSDPRLGAALPFLAARSAASAPAPG